MVRFLRYILSAIILSACSFISQAVTDTMTGIFDDRFRTLSVTLSDSQLGYPPILQLYGDDILVIEFDELADDRSFLRYSVTHCNADWQPSGLVDSEILDGFNEGNIEDWEYSRMSYTRYVHYRILLPNQDFRFKVSGNYLLKVYREDDPDTTLLQARFMVDEANATVGGQIHFATDRDYRNRHQQLSIEVDVTDAQVRDPFNDLIVTVNQNNRYDNEVALRQPLRAMGDKAFYEHNPKLIFEGGNNYRRFEIISTTVPTTGVEFVEFNDPYYHATLTPDDSRNEQSYTYDLNLHGNYVVRERESDQSEIDADYVVTHFALEIPRIPGKSIFIDSDITYRRFSPESMMIWNEATQRYERTMLLKQGAYSYQYLTVGSGETAGSTADIEGDSYQTRNIYLVKVYHRRLGERYDRLLGYTLLTF